MVAHSTRRGLGKSHLTKERSIAMSRGKILRRRRVKVQSALSELHASWAQLPRMERVERLRALIDKGFSRRAIGRGLECSEGLIRQLLELESLTAEERQAVSDGSLFVHSPTLLPLKAGWFIHSGGPPSDPPSLLDAPGAIRRSRRQRVARAQLRRRIGRSCRPLRRRVAI